MHLRKIIITLLIINIMQFIVGLMIWLTSGRTLFDKENVYLYLSMAFMLFNSSITIFGLYIAGRKKSVSLEESIKNLEDLNVRLRAQRHDYLNHFQVIYGLIELGEYEEVKKYLTPVYKDIMKVSKALKTALPAVNALLQAKIEAADRKSIDLFLEVRSDLKEMPVEPWNLCKILANIIDNGITALSEVEGDKFIHIEIDENQSNYTFLIENNGPEIPKHLQNDVFKQGISTKKEQEHGMGLYIVSLLVKEAGGTIKLASDTEQTSFYIEIPKRSS